LPVEQIACNASRTSNRVRSCVLTALKLTSEAYHLFAKDRCPFARGTSHVRR
jgi:hypothetical protein